MKRFLALAIAALMIFSCAACSSDGNGDTTAAEGTTAAEIAKRYIAEYKTDAHGLNVMDADVHPTVTSCMDLIIDIVKKLVDSGHAYAAANGKRRQYRLSRARRQKQ